MPYSYEWMRKIYEERRCANCNGVFFVRKLGKTQRGSRSKIRPRMSKTCGKKKCAITYRNVRMAKHNQKWKENSLKRKKKNGKKKNV